jgi:hypothetical protein
MLGRERQIESTGHADGFDLKGADCARVTHNCQEQRRCFVHSVLQFIFFDSSIIVSNARDQQFIGHIIIEVSSGAEQSFACSAIHLM